MLYKRLYKKNLRFLATKEIANPNDRQIKNQLAMIKRINEYPYTKDFDKLQTKDFELLFGKYVQELLPNISPTTLVFLNDKLSQNQANLRRYFDILTDYVKANKNNALRLHEEFLLELLEKFHERKIILFDSYFKFAEELNLQLLINNIDIFKKPNIFQNTLKVLKDENFNCIEMHSLLQLSVRQILFDLISRLYRLKTTNKEEILNKLKRYEENIEHAFTTIEKLRHDENPRYRKIANKIARSNYAYCLKRKVEVARNSNDEEIFLETYDSLNLNKVQTRFDIRITQDQVSGEDIINVLSPKDFK